MKRVCVISMIGFLMLMLSPAMAANWPTFRGPDLTGVAPDANPPTTWSETENIKWKVAVPGVGLSSPVIWGDKIFFATSIEEGQAQAQPAQQAQPAAPQRGGRGGRGGMGGMGGGGAPSAKYKFDVVCMDRNTGKILWQTTVKEAVPHEGHHADGSYASYTPVTDGKLIWANFGSQGLHCLDVDGNLKWSKELVKLNILATFGEGSSAAIAGNAVVVVSDHEGQSYIYAFDKVTGEELWKKERDEATSWATPLPIEVNGKIQIVTNATNFARSYDLETGEVLWQCSGQTRNAIPTPLPGNGKVYLISGFMGGALYAVDPTKTGDITNTDAVLWKMTESTTPYVPSGILINDKIYVCANNDAVVSCYQAEDGKANFVKQTVQGVRGVYASMVGAGDKIYLAGRNGVTAVLKASDTLEVLATNTLDAGIDATPAIVGDELYIKTRTHLYCIATK